MELDPFVRYSIEATRDYISKKRGGRDVDFQLERDENGWFHARFTFGREAIGSLTQAVFRAIANAIEPLEQQDNVTLRKE